MRHLSAQSQAFHRRLSTESGVYGVVMVSGLIAVSGAEGKGALRTLLVSIVTLLVFWMAHIFAGAVARHGTLVDGELLGLRSSLRESFSHAQGMLIATIVPGLLLAAGALGLIGDDTAQWTALWANVLVLAGIGAFAYRRKGANLLTQALGALITASFGIAIILIKAFVTH